MGAEALSEIRDGREQNGGRGGTDINFCRIAPGGYVPGLSGFFSLEFAKLY